MMETVKLNNDVMETSPSAAGFFYRRIGGTLFKVRVYAGSGYADTLDEKIPRLILNEMVTGAESYVNRDSPQMSQPPENKAISVLFPFCMNSVPAVRIRINASQKSLRRWQK